MHHFYAAYYTRLHNACHHLADFVVRQDWLGRLGWRLTQWLHDRADYYYGQFVLHNLTCYCTVCLGADGVGPDHTYTDPEYVSCSEWHKAEWEKPLVFDRSDRS